MLATGAGLDGVVMLIIWTKPSCVATRAYVEDPVVSVAMPRGSRRARPAALLTCATGDGLDGVVMLIIWTPWSADAETRAYVEESIVTVVT